MTFTGKHILYRLWSTDRRLLYVGMTGDLHRRLDAHRQDKTWWGEVADASVEFCRDREALEAAEALAILTETPAYNINGGLAPREVRGPGPNESRPYSVRLSHAEAGGVQDVADSFGVAWGEAARRLLDYATTVEPMPEGWHR